MGDLTTSALVQARLQLASTADVVTDIDTFIDEAEETIYGWFGFPLFVWDIGFNVNANSQVYYFPERIAETNGVSRVFAVDDEGEETTLTVTTHYTLDMDEAYGQMITINTSNYTETDEKIIVIGIPVKFQKLATLMACWAISDVIFKANPDLVSKDHVDQLKATAQRLWDLCCTRISAVTPPSNNYFNRVDDSFGMTEKSNKKQFNNRYRWLQVTHG